MYERFKNELLMNVGHFPSDILETLSKALDSVAVGYSIKKAETALSVIGREEFKQIAGAYIITKKTEGLTDGSLENMARTINNFIMSVVKPIRDVKPNDIRAYLYDYQRERGISNRTLDHMRTSICSFFHWASAEGYIPSDPASNIKPIKFSRKPRKALTQIELERVRRACKTERETCIVEVLYSTGCRISELCSIRIDDVNLDKREILILGKGNKYRTVFLNAKALISIQSYLNNRKHVSPYLICNERGGGQLKKDNVEKIFRRIKDETGIMVTPHIMRHTMATQALTGTGVEVVQQMLGHSSIATTMIYAEVDNSNIHAAHVRSVI